MSSKQKIIDSIRGAEFTVKIGPFSVRVQSEIELVQQGIKSLYGDYQVLSSDDFCDFFVRVYQPKGLRRFFRKQVLFAFDSFVPFKPLPYEQSLHFFEWGLNWCISGYAHQYLIIHAAVVEKNNKSIILPGTPGSGKSTLCAALINNGWRLLSDELALIDCHTGTISPVPRPVSLKNESIEIIKNTYPDNLFSPTVHDTQKGSVGLMRAPTASVLNDDKVVDPCFVVFPKYVPQYSGYTLSPVSSPEAFMRLADMTFNYNVLGKQGFMLIKNLVNQCHVFDFKYDGDFEQALTCFERLIEE